MHGDTHSARIAIPKAHVIGRGDAYRECSKALLGLCDPQEVKVYNHKGAHIVPRGEEAMEDLTAASEQGSRSSDVSVKEAYCGSRTEDEKVFRLSSEYYYLVRIGVNS